MSLARASSTLAPPKRRTYSSPNCFRNASLLPDLLNSSKSLTISMAASSDDCSLVIVSSASLLVDQVRGRQTSFNIVLELRHKPLEPVRLGIVGQHLGL